MAGILEALGELRGRLEGGRESMRARILQPILEQFENKAREKDRQALKGGTGRGGILSQFGTETAGQIGPLLESDNPQMQALGSTLLGQLVGAKAAPKGLSFDEKMTTPAQRVQARDQRSQFGQSYALQQQGQANDVANADRNYALDQRRTAVYEDAQRAAIQAAMAPPAPPAPPTDAKIFEQAAGYPLPKDYIAGFNPNTQKLEPVPAPNTAPYLKAAAEVDIGEKLARTVTRYLALVDAVGPTGTELIGPKAGALRSAREDVISAYRERAALGTPTGSELERVEDILPDPTGYYRNSWSALGTLGTLGLASSYIKESQMAPYKELLEAVTQDLDTKYKRNWWIPATPGIRPP